MPLAEVHARRRTVAREPQPEFELLARSGFELVLAGHLRSPPIGIDRRGSGYDVVVDSVLRISGLGRPAEEARDVGLVLAEEQFGRGAARTGPRRKPPAVPGYIDGSRASNVGGARLLRDDKRTLGAGIPGPNVAIPERWENHEFGRLRPDIANADADAQIEWRRLRVFDPDFPI